MPQSPPIPPPSRTICPTQTREPALGLSDRARAQHLAVLYPGPLTSVSLRWHRPSHLGASAEWESIGLKWVVKCPDQVTRGPKRVVRSAQQSVCIGWLVCSVLGIPYCPSAICIWVRVDRVSCLVVIGLALHPRDRWPSGLCPTLVVADITFHRCHRPVFCYFLCIGPLLYRSSSVPLLWWSCITRTATYLAHQCNSA
jgi:hypothetical protein